MFTATLFIVAKIGKQPKCPTDDWIKKMWYIYTIEYYSVIKKNENLPLAATCVDLEGIMLSEISHTEEDKYYMLQLVCVKSKKHNKLVNIQTHRYREQMIGERGAEERQLGLGNLEVQIII